MRNRAARTITRTIATAVGVSLFLVGVIMDTIMAAQGGYPSGNWIIGIAFLVIGAWVAVSGWLITRRGVSTVDHAKRA